MPTVSAASAQATRLRELIQGVKFAMLTTRAVDGTLTSRPMTTLQTDFDGSLWFIASADSVQAMDIEQRPKVNVGYASPESGRYVSVQGTAEVTRDAGKAKALWNPVFEAWFPAGPEDANLAVLRIEIASADYWETPTERGERIYALEHAARTGDTTPLGERTHIELHPPTEHQRPQGTC